MDAYNGRDFEAAVEDFDGKITFELAAFAGGAAPTLNEGIDGVRRFWADVEESFEGFRLEPSEFRDTVDTVLCKVRMAGRGRGSGADAEILTYCVTDFRDGRIARIRYFLDEAEALEAAGLG